MNKRFLLNILRLAIFWPAFIVNGIATAQCNFFYQEAFRDIYFPDDDIGFIAGDRGLILKTTDGGDNWEQTNVPFKIDFAEIKFLNTQFGIAVGSNGAVKTEDGGNTWTSVWSESSVS